MDTNNQNWTPQNDIHTAKETVQKLVFVIAFLLFPEKLSWKMYELCPMSFTSSVKFSFMLNNKKKTKNYFLYIYMCYQMKIIFYWYFCLFNK